MSSLSFIVLFVYLLYYLSDTFSKDTWKLLLDACDNIDENINKTVKITGFVFRMPDFKETYFVCGRYTISNSEDMVAGILCDFESASKLLDNEWIEITGIISKCDYNGQMPVIKVGSVQKVEAPTNTFVTLNNEEN